MIDIIMNNKVLTVGVAIGAVILISGIINGTDPALGDWLNILIGLSLVAAVFYFVILQK